MVLGAPFLLLLDGHGDDDVDLRRDYLLFFLPCDHLCFGHLCGDRDRGRCLDDDFDDDDDDDDSGDRGCCADSAPASTVHLRLLLLLILHPRVALRFGPVVLAFARIGSGLGARFSSWELLAVVLLLLLLRLPYLLLLFLSLNSKVDEKEMPRQRALRTAQKGAG